MITAPARRVAVLARSDDAPGNVGRLRDRLVERYGPDRVAVLDESSVHGSYSTAGGPSPYAAFLVILGPRWPRPETGDSDGSDALVGAVLAALESGCPVLPVVVGGRPMPPATALPDSLAGLGRLNIVELADESWPADLRARVFPFLDRWLGGRLGRVARHPASIAALVAVAIGGSLVGWWASGLGPHPASPLAPVAPFAKLGFAEVRTACYTLLVPRENTHVAPTSTVLPGNACGYVLSTASVDTEVFESNFPTLADYPDHPQSLADQTRADVRQLGDRIAREQRIAVDGYPAEEVFAQPPPGLGYTVDVIVTPSRPFLWEGGQAEGFLFATTGPRGSLPVIDHIIDNITFNQSDLP